VFDRNGNAGPTIWVDGRVVGAWMQTPTGEIRTEYAVDVPAAARAAVDAEAQRLRGAAGETRFTVRFLSPGHRAMLD
jgi:hypothetical protein